MSPYAFATAAEHYAALLSRRAKRAAARRSTPTRRCRNGTASTASICPKAGASGTTAARRRCRRSCRCSRPSISSAWCGSSITKASTRRTNGRRRTAGPKGSCGSGRRARSRSASSMTPEVVVFLGSGSGNIVRVGAPRPRASRSGQDIPQWYGDTIAFWDGDALIMHTANVQAWTQHTTWEFSYEFETVEILTPARDAAGKLLGIDWETVIYDSEALAQPVRILWHRNYQQGWEQGGPARLGRVHARALSDRRVRDAGRAGRDDRVQSAGHVRPAVGEDLGRAFREGHGQARGRARPRFQVNSAGGAGTRPAGPRGEMAMSTRIVSAVTGQRLAAFGAIVAAAWRPRPRARITRTRCTTAASTRCSRA